jgi:membrane protease YdiL (CAAX protease family)
MRVWGLAATLGFAILAFGLGQAVGVAVLTALETIDPHRVNDDGTAVALVTLVAIPVQVVTLVLAVRMTGADVRDYFGLRLPRWRDAAIAIAGLAAVVAVGDIAVVALGHDLVPASQMEMFRSAQTDGTLPLLLLALVVVGPAGEELLFRGFLFRGLVHEPRDALPGILAIALIWSLLHVQYDWLGAGLVFALGIMFGYVRLYSGSTVLVMVLHMLLNLESLGETVAAMGGI